jgi:hypothetical protein
VQDIQRSIKLTNKTNEYVAVDVNDLYEAWRLGVLLFAEEIEKDPNRKSQTYSKAEKFFSELGLKDLSEILIKLDTGQQTPRQVIT